MPRIIVTTEAAPERAGAMLLDERILASDLESDHFAAQLIERIGWALFDADDTERAPAAR
jgi:hypothetical protein